MTLTLTVFWLVLISAITCAAAWYVRKSNRPDALVVLYATIVLFADITASKIIGFNIAGFVFYSSPAVLMFAVTFLLTDIVNERFGRTETMRMIVLTVCAEVLLILFSQIVLRATPAPFFTNQAAFETVLGTVPRITIASLIAFLTSELFDAYLFQWFRKLTGGKYLWTRNALSSIPSMAVDSILFTTLAFWGVMPVVPIIIGLLTLKWFAAIIDIPFMYAAKAIMEKER